MILAADWSWFFKTYEQYQGVNPSHIAYMMVWFWVSLIAFWLIAGKRLVQVIEERESRTEGARAEAAEFESKFNDRLKAYEERVAAARGQATEERNRIRRDATAEESNVLSAARDEATKVVEQVRAQIEQERTRVRGELKAQAEKLAVEMAEKALGRDLGGAGDASRRGPARTGVTS